MLHPAVFSQDTGNVQNAKDTPASRQIVPIPKDSVRPDSQKKTPVANNSAQQLALKKDSGGKASVVRDSLGTASVKKDSATVSAVSRNITDSLDSLRKDSLRTAIPATVVRKKFTKGCCTINAWGSANNNRRKRHSILYFNFLIVFPGFGKNIFPKICEQHF
jgi:hypothetical protein